MKRPDPDSRAVYSTDHPEGIPVPRTPAPSKSPREISPGSTVKLRLEKSGRAGKTVTVLFAIDGPAGAVERLAKELKASCGAGGSVKPGKDGGTTIEIQGDHAEKIGGLLAKKGLKVVRAGG